LAQLLSSTLSPISRFPFLQKIVSGYHYKDIHLWIQFPWTPFCLLVIDTESIISSHSLFFGLSFVFFRPRFVPDDPGQQFSQPARCFPLKPRPNSSLSPAPLDPLKTVGPTLLGVLKNTSDAPTSRIELPPFGISLSACRWFLPPFSPSGYISREGSQPLDLITFPHSPFFRDSTGFPCVYCRTITRECTHFTEFSPPTSSSFLLRSLNLILPFIRQDDIPPVSLSPRPDSL